MPKLPSHSHTNTKSLGHHLNMGLCLQTPGLRCLSVLPRDNGVWSSTSGPHRSLQCPPSKTFPYCSFALPGAPEIICKAAGNSFFPYGLWLLFSLGPCAFHLLHIIVHKGWHLCCCHSLGSLKEGHFQAGPVFTFASSIISSIISAHLTWEIKSCGPQKLFRSTKRPLLCQHRSS